MFPGWLAISTRVGAIQDQDKGSKVDAGKKREWFRTAKRDETVSVYCCLLCTKVYSSATDKGHQIFLQCPLFYVVNLCVFFYPCPGLNPQKTGLHLTPSPSAVFSVDPSLMHPKTEPSPAPQPLAVPQMQFEHSQFYQCAFLEFISFKLPEEDIYLVF